MPEEEAFAVLVSIMQDYSMRAMYKPDMFSLGLCIYQLESMVQVRSTRLSTIVSIDPSA
jgi:hypothetical protein